MQGFGARLRAAMIAAGISDISRMAAKANVSPQMVRRWLRSKEPNLSAQHLLRVAVVLSVRAHWLGTGEGPIHRYHASQYSEAEMLATFRQLSERERVMLRDMAGMVFKFARED